MTHSITSQDPITIHPIARPNFAWGSVDADTFSKELDKAYKSVVHWRRNLFRVPHGNAGKLFVTELVRLYTAFATGSALESIALKATVVIPHLLLQKPQKKSKTKDHIACLQRRMETWANGDLQDLLGEGTTIQQRLLKTSPHSRNHKNPGRKFEELMFQGKTHAALELISHSGKGGFLHLNDVIETEENIKTVKEILKSKHPPNKPANTDACWSGTPPQVHPVIFDSINATVIRSAVLRTRGACGPSGLDAYEWRRLCTSFKRASDSLCEALSQVAKRLCSDITNPDTISPLLACRLIALDKCPGVRPIGIGDTSLRIMAKAILHVFRNDVQEAAGSRQLRMCGIDLWGRGSNTHGA